MRSLLSHIVLALSLALLVLSAAGCSSVSKPDDFVITDGVLTEYTGKAKDIVVPDTVTTIGKGVFKESKIKTVVIPDSVKVVGYEAFFHCDKLTKVTLPDNGIPISFNADGTISADYKIGFSVQLRMDDGSVINADRYEILLDEDRNEYRYRLYYTTGEKPKDVLINGTKESFVLNGKTYAEYKNWETGKQRSSSFFV